MGASFYNGYSPAERDAKYQVLMERIAIGEQPEAAGPCMLCGDPTSPVMYHDEDYSLPYLWESPALLVLCGNCHKDKLHKRFGRPPSHWHAFIAHVRRGGWASDIAKDAEIRKEVDRYRRALEAGEPFELRSLRPYVGVVGEEWFANLRLDEASKTDPAARPRP